MGESRPIASIILVQSPEQWHDLPASSMALVQPFMARLPVRVIAELLELLLEHSARCRKWLLVLGWVSAVICKVTNTLLHGRSLGALVVTGGGAGWGGVARLRWACLVERLVSVDLLLKLMALALVAVCLRLLL